MKALDPQRWQQIEPLLDAALDRPLAERAAFLDEACAGDRALRSALEVLLRDCDEAADFLEDAGGKALAEIAASSPFDPLALGRIGQRLGSYRLLRILGQGGMGTVYLAERVDGEFEQQVAIKLASRQDRDPDAVARFRFERQILARLEHPNIARLLDGGVTVEGAPFLVMERVDGEPLDQACEALPLARRLALVQEVCRAVAYAHRRKVVHRDLKPSNVLVTPQGQVKLLDFGIAELLGGDGETVAAREEGSGSRLTLSYAAPELLAGQSATSSSDIYSLGVLLYRLLAGRLPFDPRGTSAQAWEHRVAQEAPAPPSRWAPLPRRKRRELDAIVLKALAKRPQDRYSSAGALEEDLQRFLQDQPVQALPHGLPYVFRKHLRRHRWFWLAGAVAASLLLVATGGWVRSRRQALLRAELAQRFGQEAERIEWFLRHAQALPRHDIRRERSIMERRLKRLRIQMAGLGEAARGPGHFALGRGYARLHQPRRAVAALETAWQEGYRTAEVALTLGKALGEVFDLQRDDALRIRDPEIRAERLKELETRYLDRARAFLGQAGSPELESSSYLFALIAYYDGRWEEALRRTEAARQEAPWMADSLRLQGEIHLRQAQEDGEEGRYEAAQSRFDQAVASFSQALALAPSDAALYEGLCRVWERQLEMDRLRGENDDQDYQRGLESCGWALEVDPTTPDAYLQLAVLHMTRLQKPGLALAEVSSLQAQAEAAARRGLELAPGRSEAHQALGTTLLARALVLELPQGREATPTLDAAARAFRHAVKLDPGRVVAYSNLGTTLALRAARAQAAGQNPLAIYREAVGSFEQALDRAPKKALLLYNLANLLRDQAQYETSRGLDSASSLRLARSRAQEAIELNPRLIPGLNLLGALEDDLSQLAWDQGGDPKEHFSRALEFFHRALEESPGYYRAVVNEASVLRHRALWKIARGEDPEADLASAVEAIERARELGAPADPIYTLNLTEVYLLEAEWAAVSGGTPKPWLAQRWLTKLHRPLQTGLEAFPENTALLTAAAQAELLAYRQGIPFPLSPGPSAAARLQDRVARDEHAWQGRVVLAELLVECALGQSGSAGSAGSAPSWCPALAEGGSASPASFRAQAQRHLAALTQGSPTQLRRRQGLLSCLEALESPSARAAAKEAWRRAAAPDALLLWRTSRCFEGGKG
jgi:serine/threonine-protein kinase